jgi:hypothetical protein
MSFISGSLFQKSGSRYSKEDSVQIPTQRNWIPRFLLDGPIRCPNSHQCLEDSNSSRLQQSGRHGNTFGRSLEFDKKSDLLFRHMWEDNSIGPDNRVTPSGRDPWRIATVRTTGHHRPEAVLIMVITSSRSATVRMIGEHHPDAALIWIRVECVMKSQLHSCPSERSQLPSRSR